MLRLEMNTTRGQIGMQSSPPRLSLETTQKTLNLTTTQPKVRVEATLPKISIDQSQCFSEAGLKGIVDFAAEYVSYAKSKMYESMARIAEQGNALTDIQYGGSPLADQALYNAYDQFMNEFNYGTVPRSRPRISLQEGQLDIKVTEGRVENRTAVQKPVVQYQKGNLQIYLATQPSIEMHAVDIQV